MASIIVNETLYILQNVLKRYNMTFVKLGGCENSVHFHHSYLCCKICEGHFYFENYFTVILHFESKTD